MVLKNKYRKKQIRIIEQEIALVKFLSSNNENERNKALKKTKRVLEFRSQVDCDFNENEARVLWKGLFYCIWMADKPLYQEQVAECISQMIHCFTRLRDALIFVEGFFQIMSQEWLGIDQFRLDKCMMLVRRMVRQSMIYVKQRDNWSSTSITQLANCYGRVLRRSAKGLVMQLSELYLNELAKVSEGKLSPEQVFELVRPFAEYFITLNDGRLISQIIVPIFYRLIEQTDIGIEYQMKWQAWRDRGFPGGSIDVMEKVEDDDDEEGEGEKEEEAMNGNMSDDDDDDDDDADIGSRPLDPRAGRVDVELPLLNIDPRSFVAFFNQLKETKDISQLSRKQLTVLINKYSTLAEGKFPLGMQKVDLPPKTNWKNFTIATAKKLAVDLLDDEIEKLESLKKDLNVSSELESSVGRWLVESTESNRRKKSMKRLAAKRVEKKWMITPVANNGNEVVGDGSSVKSVEESKVQDDGAVTKKKKKRKLENDFPVGKSKVKKCVSNGTGEMEKSRMKNGDVDGDWGSGLEEGETEIFIPNKKYVKRREKLGLPVPEFEFVQKVEANSAVTPTQRKSINGKDKKVLFVLTRNKSQDEKEYQKTLKTNPELPYSAEKHPTRPIYKNTGVVSPINPFYKRMGYTKI